MKITKLETLALTRMHEPERVWYTSRQRIVKADCAIVIIHTDEGLTGIGEASSYGWPLQIREWVEWLAPTLIGKDPLDPTIVPHPNGRSRPHDTAVAGIDIALWDLKAKISGQPLSKYLNPNAQDRVRLYASAGCQYDWRYNPEKLITDAVDYIDQGFKGLKFRIGTEWTWDGVTVDRFLGHVGELVQEVDGRMELAMDGNCRLTFDQSLEIAKAFDKWGFAWFEEPMPRDPDTYAALAGQVETPITGGETFDTLEEFRPYLEKKAYDMLQPDIAMCGLTEANAIAEMGYRYGCKTLPHSWHNGLMCIEHAHWVAALDQPYRLELCMHQGPLQWGILKGEAPIEDGYVILPDGPGLGVELEENLEEKYPHVEGLYAVMVER